MADRLAAERRGISPWLLLSFVGVGVAFLVATGFAQYRAAAIDKRALSIARNASPSIEHLTAIRADLRHLQVIADELVHHPSAEKPVDRGPLDEIRRHLDHELKAYLGLEVYDGETKLSARVSQGLSRVNEVLDGLELQLEARDATAARLTMADLGESIEQASEAVMQSVKFDADQSKRLALEIESIRSRSMVTAFVLDGLCVALTIVAAVLVARMVRSYTTLLESHHRLAERRAQELELFAGRASHDILSPLGMVGMAVEAARIARTQQESRDFLLRGRACLQRVKAVVTGLLEFARAGVRRPDGASAKAADVVPGLLSEIGHQAQEANVELELETCDPCTVAAAPGVLMSILGNLARNAIKYMGARPVRRVTIRVLDRSPMARLEVEDTGQGIQPELHERIFEPYTRGQVTDQSGVGLGLATVKRLAEAHGGAVGLRSRLGEGSLFWVELPLAAPGSTIPGSAATGSTPQGSAAPAAAPVNASQKTL